MEPKISGTEVDEVCMKLGKTHQSRAESEDFSRGVWVLWNEEDVRLRIRFAHRNILHAEISQRGGDLGVYINLCKPICSYP